MTTSVKRLLLHVTAGLAMLLVLIAQPVPTDAVNGSFTVVTPLRAETSLALEADTDGTMVVTVYIERIKHKDTGLTQPIPGGIGSYSATAIFPSDMDILQVRGVAPYNSPVFDPETGIFAVGSVAAPEQPNHSPVAKLVVRLTGTCLSGTTLDVAFQQIIAAGDPLLNVPEEHPNSRSFLRGDARLDGVVNIVDAMFIAQYTVGLRTLGELNAVNAASVKYDGGGDTINIVDAMFIAQYTVGLRNSSFNAP